MSNPTLQSAIEDMTTYIKVKVAAGFQPANEIQEMAAEVFSEPDIVNEIAKAAEEITKQAIANHLITEKSWPEKTDSDRLEEAFKALEIVNIIVRQDFSCCGTCASGEMLDEIEEERIKGRIVRGYAMYDMQDTEAAINGYGLCLSYGNPDQTETDAVRIGQEIVSVLRKHGFSPEWDGSWSKRIQIPMKWQRRFRYK
jgi:hypothetical protein